MLFLVLQSDSQHYNMRNVEWVGQAGDVSWCMTIITITGISCQIRSVGTYTKHLPVSQGRKTLLSSPTCKLSHSRAVADKTDLTLNSCWTLLRLELRDALPSQAINQTQVGLCLGGLSKMKDVLKQSAVNTRHKNLLIGRSIYMSSGLVLLSQMSHCRPGVNMTSWSCWSGEKIISLSHWAGVLMVDSVGTMVWGVRCEVPG